jgi:hypothetical protein
MIDYQKMTKADLPQPLRCFRRGHQLFDAHGGPRFHPAERTDGISFALLGLRACGTEKRFHFVEGISWLRAVPTKPLFRSHQRQCLAPWIGLSNIHGRGWNGLGRACKLSPLFLIVMRVFVCQEIRDEERNE